MNPIDRFESLQSAIAGYLLSCSFFATAGLQVFVGWASIDPYGNMILSPDLQSTINDALSGGLGGPVPAGSKTGAVCIVTVPTISATSHVNNTPQQMVDITIRFLENVTYNYAATGTGIPAIEFARQALTELTGWSPGTRTWGATNNASQGLRPREGRTIVPIVIESDTGFRQYDLNMFAYTMPDVVKHMTTPTIIVTGSSVTISSPDAGAVIRYTTNGTFPWAGNSTATLYSAPFTLPSGGTVKAVAFPS
jgi:hypothetical protein